MGHDCDDCCRGLSKQQEQRSTALPNALQDQWVSVDSRASRLRVPSETLMTAISGELVGSLLAIALFTVSFSHLHYNVIKRGCEAISVASHTC